VDLVVSADRTHALRLGIAREVLELSAVGRSAQILGAARACLELTHSYVTVRHQFGKPLAARQVVRHELAALACEVAAAEAAVAHAVAALPATGDAPSPSAQLAVASAKVQCARSATRVARTAHQLHGAVGITAEHPLHHVTTRLWAWRDEAGSGRYWSARVSELIHDAFGSDLWTALTAGASTHEGNSR
jgi:acyl-CoA dehydrogenase